MRYVIVTLICTLCSFTQAQIVTPYNPDSNQDSAIGSADLVDFLAYFGYPFTPDAIEINGEDFLSTLITLTEQVSTLQEQVSTLQAEAMTKDSVLKVTWLRNLRHVNLEGATMVDMDLNRVDFSYANFQSAQLMNSSFGDGILEGTDLSGANLFNADFDAAILANANLSGAVLTYAYFGYTSLEGANLSGTDMSDSYVEGAILTCLQGCPDTAPSGMTCIPDEDCDLPNRFRIVEED